MWERCVGENQFGIWDGVGLRFLAALTMEGSTRLRSGNVTADAAPHTMPSLSSFSFRSRSVVCRDVFSIRRTPRPIDLAHTEHALATATTHAV